MIRGRDEAGRLLDIVVLGLVIGFIGRAILSAFGW